MAFQADGKSALTYRSMDECQSAISSTVFLLGQRLLCGAKDGDGASPTAVYAVAKDKPGPDGVRKTPLVLRNMDECQGALTSAVVSQGRFHLCASKDQDGASPTRLFRLDSNAGFEQTKLILKDLAECRQVLSSAVSIGGRSHVCASKDGDGASPTRVFQLDPGATSEWVETNLVLRDMAQCRKALAAGVLNQGQVRLCASKDRDGASPYGLYEARGADSVMGDKAFGDFDACRSAMPAGQRGGVATAAAKVAAAPAPAPAAKAPPMRIPESEDAARAMIGNVYDAVYEKADGDYDKIYEKADSEYDRIVDQISDDAPYEQQSAARTTAMEARSKEIRDATETRSKLIRDASQVRSRLIQGASRVRGEAIQRASRTRGKQQQALSSGGLAAFAAEIGASSGTAAPPVVAGGGAKPGVAALAAPAAAPEPTVVGDLGAEALPAMPELVDKHVTCKVQGKAALVRSDERRDALGLSGTSPLVLELTCGGATSRKVQLFAGEARALELFDIGDGTGLTVLLKDTASEPLAATLHAIDDVRTQWLPELPPSPREAPGFAKADAQYQAAAKALAAEIDKEVADLAKAQAKAVAQVPRTHSKELAEMNQEHAMFKREKNGEINERVREMNEEVREALSDCAGEYGEDARDCRSDVRDTKQENAEEVRELRSEVADAIKEGKAEHLVAIADHKATLPDMLQEARVEGSRAILAVKAKQKEKLTELATARARAVGGASGLFPLVAQTIQTLCTKRGVPVPEAIARRIAEAGTSGASKGGHADAYPAACTGLDMTAHVKVAGDAGWCVPTDPGRVLVMGAKSFEGCGDSYDDEDEFTVLGNPDKRLGEMREISGAERSAKSAETRSNIYYTELGSCNGELTETSGQFALACDLTDESFFTSKPPTVKRTQKCETERADRCSDTCSDDDDCDGFLCGCPESRCFFFRCSGCPAERLCEEPEFKMSISPYKVGRALKGGAKDLAREISVGESDHKAIIGFKVSSVWRKLFMGRECDEDYDGRRVCESVLEHSEGFRAKVTPVFSGYVHCPNGECGKSKAASLSVKTGSFTVTLENNGHSAKVTCGATCKASNNG
jgi:hypothetical protein